MANNKVKKATNSRGKRITNAEKFTKKEEKDVNACVTEGRPKRILKSNPRYVDDKEDKDEVEIRKVKSKGKKCISPKNDETANENLQIVSDVPALHSKKMTTDVRTNPPKNDETSNESLQINSINKKSREKKINFAIDCTATSQIMNVVDLGNYFRKNIKINGERNNFGKKVLVKEKNMKVFVKSSCLKKKDLKYWTKKFLKEKKLRQSVSVRSNGKFSYKLNELNK